MFLEKDGCRKILPTKMPVIAERFGCPVLNKVKCVPFKVKAHLTERMLKYAWNRTY